MNPPRLLDPQKRHRHRINPVPRISRWKLNALFHKVTRPRPQLIIRRFHRRQPHTPVLDQIRNQTNTRYLITKLIRIKRRCNNSCTTQVLNQHLTVRLRLHQHRIRHAILRCLDRRAVVIVPVINRHALHHAPQDRPLRPVAPHRQKDQVRYIVLIIKHAPCRGRAIRRCLVRRQRRIPRLYNVLHLRRIRRPPPLEPRLIDNTTIIHHRILLIQRRPDTARRGRLAADLLQFLFRELFRPQRISGLTPQNVVIHRQRGQNHPLPLLALTIPFALIQATHVVAQMPARPNQDDRRVLVLTAREKIRTVPCP